MGTRLGVFHVVILLLVIEPSIQQVAQASNFTALPKLPLWNSPSDLLEHGKKDLNKIADQVSTKYSSFLGAGRSMEQKMAEWAVQHSSTLGQCFAKSALPESEREHMQSALSSLFAPSTQSGLNIVSSAKQIIFDRVPMVSFLSQQLKDRPDFALSVIKQVQSFEYGKKVMEVYFHWIGESDRVEGVHNLLQMQSSNFPYANQSEDTIAILLQLNQRSMADGEDGGGTSGPASLFGEGPSAAMYEGMSKDSAGQETTSLSSVAGISSSQSSSGGGTSSSATANEDGDAGMNTGGGDAARGDSSSSGSGGGRKGCCGALLVMVTLLGVGCAAEFYAKNMHKYDGDKYEELLTHNIEENVKQLKEYLETHPSKLQLLKEKMNDDSEERLDELEDEATVGAGHTRERHDSHGNTVSVEKLLHIPLNYQKITEGLEPKPDAEIEAHHHEMKTASKTSNTGSEPEREKEKDPKNEHGHPEQGKKVGKANEEAMMKMHKSFKEVLPKMLSVFYIGYSAVPAIVSKQFGFYFFLMVLGIILSSVM